MGPVGRQSVRKAEKPEVSSAGADVECERGHLSC